MDKKGVAIEGVSDILMWVAFLIIAAAAVWFIVKRLTG